MPTDQSTDPAPTTTRRSFLTRTAVGSALVTAGAMAAPVGRLLPLAGAQGADPDATLLDVPFASVAAPLELAAVLAYQAAFDTHVLDDPTTARLREFQGHHDTVATALIALLPADAEAPVANETYAKQWSAATSAPTDANGIFKALSQVEETMSATHLDALGSLIEPTTAKLVAQVLTVEAQQAVLLASAAGASIDELTPPEANTDASVLAAATKAAAATTTTTAAN